MEAGFDCVEAHRALSTCSRNPPFPTRSNSCFRMQEEERILVVPGRGFGRKGYFRVAYCVPLETIRKAIPGFLRMGRQYAGGR